MKTRRLGRTQLDVTELGYGTWGLGGDSWRGVDPRAAQRALYHALDAGVTFVDTALSYGDGAAETLVGEVVRDLRARDWAVVATKVPPRGKRWPAPAGAKLEEEFPVDYVTRCVEQSLRNLRAEILVLEQLHVWRDEWLDSPAWPELRGTMERLVREGKVLHWGISANAHEADNAVRILDESIIGTVQVIFNIFDQSAEETLLPRAMERDVGVIARVPLDEGALSGAIDAQTSFPADDFRARYFAGARKAEVAARVDALRPLLGDEAQTMAELALRFCLHRPEVSTVITGMRRREHVDANIAVSDGRTLSSRLLAKLEDHTWSKNWYAEP